MFYKGKIAEINKLVVADPSYGKDVWCRYECTDPAKGKPWNVQLAVNDVTTPYEDFTCKGVEFSLLLASGSIPPKAYSLNSDGNSFSYPKLLSLQETEIGMDTACVALGINELADEINASRDVWQPACALHTLTDGLFGTVSAGSCYGQTHFFVITGYLDEDAGYSVDDIVQYLTSAFQIKDLERVQDMPALEDKISDAQKEHLAENKSGAAKESEREI